MTWNVLEQQPKDINLQTMNKPQPPETIHGVFMRYVFFLGLFAGIGRMGEAIADPMMSRLVATFGYGTFVAFLACMFYEWRYTERKWTLYEQQERARTGITAKGESVKSGTTTEIHNHYKTSGGERTEIHSYPSDKLPPERFIRAIFASAGTDGRVPSERSIREVEEWRDTAFNEWLDTMDKEGITVHLDARPNSARKVVGTVEDALKHFGYLSPALPIDVTRK